MNVSKISIFDFNFVKKENFSIIFSLILLNLILFFV